MICKKCGHKQLMDFDPCPKCGYSALQSTESRMAREEVRIEGHDSELANKVSERPILGEDSVKALRLFALLDLIATIVAVFSLWKRLEALVCIAILLSGMLVCSFCYVIASIGENLIALRKEATRR